MCRYFNNKYIKIFPLLIIVIFNNPLNICFALPELRLIDVKVITLDTHERIELFFNRQPNYHFFYLEKPNRLVLDFDNCLFVTGHKVFNVISDNIKRIRISQFNSNIARFVIDQRKKFNLLIYESEQAKQKLFVLELRINEKTISAKFKKGLDLPADILDLSDKSDYKQKEAIKRSEIAFNDLFTAPDRTPCTNPENSITKLSKTPEQNSAKHTLTGSLKNSTAYRTAKPHAFSKIKNDLKLTSSCIFSTNLSYSVSTLLSYDAIYDTTDYYNKSVEDDQKITTQLKDAYIDIGTGNLEWRLGRQQIVWGEAVGGLFFADIVNPKDLREYILPELDDIRIPVFAANMEYYHNDAYFQFVFIPFPEFNEFGKKGTEFDFTKGDSSLTSIDVSRLEPEKPSDSIKNSEIGFRASKLIAGWDISLFYLYAFDSFPVNYRYIDIQNSDNTSQNPLSITYCPEYERINKFGLTFSKEHKDIIFKGEFVFNHDNFFQVSDIEDYDGIIKNDSLDWLFGIDYTFLEKIDSNFQLMQSRIFGYDEPIIQDKWRTSFSIWLKTGFYNNKIEPELFFVSSFNQKDMLFRPKIEFSVNSSISLALGADIFSGEPYGDFGFFDDNDRVYLQLLYTWTAY